MDSYSVRVLLVLGGCVCCSSDLSLHVSLTFVITLQVAVLLPGLCLLQVCEHLQALGKQVGLRVIALVGGIAPVKQVGQTCLTSETGLNF